MGHLGVALVQVGGAATTGATGGFRLGHAQAYFTRDMAFSFLLAAELGLAFVSLILGDGLHSASFSAAIWGVPLCRCLASFFLLLMGHLRHADLPVGGSRFSFYLWGISDS